MNRQKVSCLLAAFLALFVVTGGARADGALAVDHPLVKLLASVSVERGREFRAMLVVPIARDTDDPAAVERPRTSREAFAAENLSIAEPEKRPGRGPIEAFNWSTKPVFILAGELFEGGRRDRFVPRDVLVEAGSKVVIPAYLADRKPRSDDDEKKTFEPLDAITPDLLRLLGLMEGAPAAVDSFLEDEYALAGGQNPRDSLVALYSSARLAARMEEYQRMFQGIPNEAGKRVVGVAVLVGDRLTGIDLFASNSSFRAHWPKILKAAAFQATLYEVSYGLLKHPFADGRDPDRDKVAIKAMLKKPLAAKVSKEKPIGAGEEIRFVRDEMIGRALTYKEQLVHTILVLDYITHKPPEPGAPPGADGTEPPETAEALGRRAARGRLTEYERRLLERMRERRRNQNPPRSTPGGANDKGGLIPGAGGN